MLNLIQKCASHRGTRVMNSLVAEFLMFCYRIFLLLARSVVHSSGNVCLCFPTLLCSYSVVFMDDFDSWRKAAPTSRWEKHCPERDLYWPLPHQHEGRRFGTGHKVTVMVVMFWRTVLLLLEWRREFAIISKDACCDFHEAWIFRPCAVCFTRTSPNCRARSC